MRRGFPSLIAEPIAAMAGLLGAATGRETAGSSAHARGWLASPAVTKRGLSLGPRVQFDGKRNIELGIGVTLFGNTYLNATRGFIKIGTDTHIDHFCVLYGQGGLTIGARCAIAAGVIIYTQTNQYAYDPQIPIIGQPVVYAPVVIGEDVWIGAGAVILPGVEIGDHAVIGAASLVRNNVPSGVIVGGVPAREIGTREKPRGFEPYLAEAK